MASPVIGRGSLPQNFLDSTTALMRLPAPQPQYFFARAAMGAALRFDALNAGAATAQQFVSEAGGGMALPPDLDYLVRAADAYPDMVQAVKSFGKGEGDTVKFTRDLFDGGGFDKSSRKLTENTTIATTGRAVKQEEVPVVLEQFHGPMQTGASAPAPFVISDFWAKYGRNKEQLSSVTSRYLVQDYVQWLDTVIRDEFTKKAANFTYASDSITAASGFVVGGSAILNLQAIMNARKALSDRNWRKFGNGRYMLLVPTKFNTDMVSDIDYRELSKVHQDGRNQLFGYIGSVQDVDIFEVSTLKAYVNADGNTADGTTVAANVTVQTSLLVGPGAVGFGSALDPECRWADDTNYGTLAKTIWYALHAFECIDNRGIQMIFSQ